MEDYDFLYPYSESMDPLSDLFPPEEDIPTTTGYFRPDGTWVDPFDPPGPFG